MLKRIEVLISGFGGQGVVRTGQILGLSAVHSDLNATMLISHGTETRGGYVRSQVVLSGEKVDSPVIERPDIFCALSRAAYNRFYGMVKDGVILYDPAYVEPNRDSAAINIPIPARDIAVSKLGNELFANMIVLGQIIKRLDGIISRENVILSMEERIPRFLEKNIEAFKIGFEI